MGSLTFLEQFERFIEGPLEELWLSFTEQAATSSERSGHFPVELGLATAHGPMRLSHVGRFWAFERGLLRTQSEYSLTRDRLH